MLESKRERHKHEGFATGFDVFSPVGCDRWEPRTSDGCLACGGTVMAALALMAVHGWMFARNALAGRALIAGMVGCLHAVR
eukprot:364429-Chlamydomonas_euryale.AAC.9